MRLSVLVSKAHIENQTVTAAERLLSRGQLTIRWSCSRETLKRREREGVLKPIRFNRRFLRYKLSDILRIENEASGIAPIFSKLGLSPNVGFRQFLASGGEAKND